MHFSTHGKSIPKYATGRQWPRLRTVNSFFFRDQFRIPIKKQDWNSFFHKTTLLFKVKYIPYLARDPLYEKYQSTCCLFVAFNRISFAETSASIVEARSLAVSPIKVSLLWAFSVSGCYAVLSFQGHLNYWKITFMDCNETLCCAFD